MATKHVPKGNRKGFATFAGSGGTSDSSKDEQKVRPAFAKATDKVPEHDEKVVADTDKQRVLDENTINAESKDLPPGLTDQDESKASGETDKITGDDKTDGPFKTTGDADQLQKPQDGDNNK